MVLKSQFCLTFTYAFPSLIADVISPLKSTDLQILAAFAPASRVRGSSESMVSYLGSKLGSEDTNNAKLWAVALPAAWIVDTSASTSSFFTGISQFVGDNIDPSPNDMNIYTASTPNVHSW